MIGSRFPQASVLAEVWLGLAGPASAARLRLLLTPATSGQPRGSLCGLQRGRGARGTDADGATEEPLRCAAVCGRLGRCGSGCRAPRCWDPAGAHTGAGLCGTSHRGHSSLSTRRWMRSMRERCLLFLLPLLSCSYSKEAQFSQRPFIMESLDG